MYNEAYKENIEKFIIFVNDLTTDLFYERLMCDGKDLYQQGGCYEFIKIISSYFDIDHILISKNYKHCAFEYKGNYYDSYGLIKNKEDFTYVTEEDMSYILEMFGGHITSYNIYETVIGEISNIEKVPYLPTKFYKSKEKIKQV